MSKYIITIVLMIISGMKTFDYFKHLVNVEMGRYELGVNV